ncbi:uncharacterized protein LOC121265693 [Juglans microcarpa x Juglans regia]|uniref:uncharacterized protein LOC121265693 n=1 Tax=Juglans microcarpa x Juglans regia TaxID=2249226 RepID=UPI001B7E9608|nr:uncharacterized protein LOC121265693 [Juglans microcarpa x Juglans regia]
MEEDMHKVEELRAAKKELETMLEQEDQKWRQRAKLQWYQKGDKNTKYFHTCATERKRRGFITKIKDQDQVLRYGKEVVDNVQTKVSDQMNDALGRIYTTEEVELALNQMSSLKSPGPDGFGAGFFQQHWHTVRDEVCAETLNFLNNGSFSSSLNYTYIALISKVSKPDAVQEFRPISLCNVLYKIVSKTISNRLKRILPNLVASNQSAFIPGRLISDNIMVAFEVLHSMRTKQKWKVGSMALKFDISKAYDRVEWNYLEAMMVKLGFEQKFISLVMMCVKSVKYSVLVNGNPTGEIVPSCGLRGSPYLFIICTEGLTTLINAAELKEQGDQIGIIYNILRTYEIASGQKLNRNKTSVFFSTNTYASFKQQIVNDVRAIACGSYERYLGLPSNDCWRFLQNPDSLVAKVFKSKYFSKESILDAKLGNSPSYIWRSIWMAREVLQEGLIWRVGNGKQISIWRHKWLPKPSSFSVQSPISSLGAEAKVYDLIDEEVHQWKEEIIRAHFHEEEAAMIYNLPISIRRGQDKQIWNWSKEGKFSVRSALPTTASLCRRQICEDSKCSICGSAEETIMHVVKDALQLNEYKEAQKKNGGRFVAEGGERTYLQKWRKPAEGIFKANFDAAIDAQKKLLGLGIIIRDWEGQIEAACSDQVQLVSDSAMAESLALRKTVQLCYDLGLNKVQFEGDALVIVNSVNKDEELWTWYG